MFFLTRLMVHVMVMNCSSFCLILTGLLCRRKGRTPRRPKKPSNIEKDPVGVCDIQQKSGGLHRAKLKQDAALPASCSFSVPAFK